MTIVDDEILTSNKFEQKRKYAREQLNELKIKENYYKMLNDTIILTKLKQEHSNNFFRNYDAIERWLDKTNTEYFCKINYQSFLANMADLAQECEVIYFGIALLKKLYSAEDLKQLRSYFIKFFSIYNIQINFSFKSKFDFKRKDLL